MPFCLAACRRSHAGIWATLFLLLTSIAWFPAPDVPHSDIQAFLQMEQHFLRSGLNVEKIFAAVAVSGSLTLTAVAFWKRSLALVVYCLVAMAGSKILWSIAQGSTAGKQVILPAALGLVICLVLLWLWRKNVV